MEKTKVIFFGTPEFSIPTLQALIKAGYEIGLVVTQPDELVGRKQIMTPPPVKVAAEKLNLPVVQDLKMAAEKIIELKPEVGVVVAYGRIIPKNILDLFPKGCINIHPSLLPKYRGPSPIQTAILNGDTEIGVTIIKLDEQMDHGPVVISEKLEVRSENYQELSQKLSETGAELLIKVMPDYLADKIKPIPQDEGLATVTKILQREDGEINWSKSAKELDRQIRAYFPWPGSYCNCALHAMRGAMYRIKILQAEATDNEFNLKPGQPHVEDDELYVQCGRGSLLIKKLQPEGRNEMLAEQFINGYLK